MKDMDRAVERIEMAIMQREQILVYGDYDVDGTTAVALVYTFLKSIYKDIDFYIPDRYSEGYGISKAGVEFAHEHGFTLVIALDCGIKAVENIQYAITVRVMFCRLLMLSWIQNALTVIIPTRNYLAADLDLSWFRHFRRRTTCPLNGLKSSLTSLW
jgi:hypothetical protein